MMANKEDLYRLEKLVNTSGVDEDEIRVLRKALWGKSYDRPKPNIYCLFYTSTGPRDEQ